MLLRVERVDARDDWDALSAIREPYQRALDMLAEDQLDAAQSTLKKAIGAALGRISADEAFGGLDANG